MKRLLFLPALLALALAPLRLSAADPAVVVNPSFEANSFTIFPGYVDNNGPITGWNAPNGSGLNPAAGSPFADNGTIPDGTQVAFIQSDVTLSQVIGGLVVGERYEVRYFENSRSCCSGTFPSLRVTMGGATVVGDHIVVAVGGANPYVAVVSDGFTATAETMELAFIKTNPQGGDTTVLIDNVSVIPFSGPPQVDIPGLYNTGVDDQGTPLPDNTADPHYILIVNPDTGSPDAIVLDSAAFPIVAGPWLANSATSKWIGPQFNTVASVADNYTYRLTFDLTGVDLETVEITGGWATDNTGVNIQVNGTDSGQTNPNGFAGLTTFTLNSANATFVDGANTLDFIVNNAPPPGYTGLRIENLRGTATLPGTPPFILAQPTGGTGGTGKSFTFTVNAEGSSPLSYQWQKGGEDVPGANEETLTLTGLTLDDAGDYAAVISNPFGSITSAPATLTMRVSVPTVFNTGVDDLGVALADGSVDSHYALIVNPDGPSSDAIVQDGSVFPINDGTWLRHNDASKWIGPRFETSAAAGGDYVYRHAFDLTGFDPDTVVITGGWTSDNAGTQVLLNGQVTGLSQPGSFGVLTPFTLDSGFLNGVNTLEFRVNNAAAGYTGLRVDRVLAVGDPLPDGTPPFIVTQPSDIEAVVTETATFTVTANGSAPIDYQWFYGLDPIPGANSPTLSFLIDFPDVGGEYSVEVSNAFGSVRSDPATLTVLGAPRITAQPQDVVVAAGDTATFSVTAVGEPPLEYQWLFEGEDIPGANEATFSIPGVFPEDGGTFSVRVSNFGGSVLSEEVTLTVLSLVPGVYNTGVDDEGVVLPDGAIDPHYRLIVNPDSASNDAIVANSGVFPISTGNWLANNDQSKWLSPRFATDAAIATGDYTYRLVVDLAGFDPASVLITGGWATDNEGLDIVVNGISTGQGNTAQFAALTPFTINSGLVAGPNTIDFVLNNALAPGPTGLRVENLRAIGRPLVGVPPSIVAQPVGGTFNPGDTVNLSVAVDGSQPISFQWYLGPDPIPGEVGQSLSFVATFLDQQGDYSVDVSNPFGSVTSAPASVLINAAPVILQQPAGTVVEEGAGASFSVQARGVEPLTFQWLFDGKPIPGADQTSLSIPGVFPEDAGAYSVVVSNPAGTVTSDPALLGIGTSVPGFFNTGVDHDGLPLADNAVDGHYVLLVNPDTGSPDAIVQDSTAFPIVDGPWLQNTGPSKWIGPRLNTSASAAATYIYRLTVDLTGFDPAQVEIHGGWAVDNVGVDIRVNGSDSGQVNPNGFGALTGFVLSSANSPFTEGLNTIDFVVENLPPPGYTGLKVEFTSALAVGAPQVPPVAQDDTFTTDEDVPLVVAAPGVLANDTDANGDPLTAHLVSGPTHGSVVLNEDGSFTYTPSANVNGADQFTYAAHDGTEDSNIATVHITVLPVNDAPDCQATVDPTVDLGNGSPYPTLIAGDGQSAVALLDASASSDIEGDALTFAWFANGEVVPFSTDAVTVAELAPGLNEVVLLVSDGSAECTTTLLIDVLTPGDAVEELVLLVDDTPLVTRKTKQPFIATLKNSAAAFDRGSFGAGDNMLHSFINKVRAQVARDNPEVAEEWTRVAELIIEATGEPAE